MYPTADLDIFFADLATTAMIGTVPVQVLFSAPSKAADAFSLGVSSTDPSCLMKSSDLAANNVDSGTPINIGGVNYLVLGSPDQDGAGFVVVTLENA